MVLKLNMRNSDDVCTLFFFFYCSFVCFFFSFCIAIFTLGVWEGSEDNLITAVPFLFFRELKEVNAIATHHGTELSHRYIVNSVTLMGVGSKLRHLC